MNAKLIRISPLTARVKLAMKCAGVASLLTAVYCSSGDALAGMEYPSDSEDCSAKHLLTDLFLIQNKGDGFKLLPSIAGATDNIPHSLPRVPENRILFGIEAEYSDQAGLGKMTNAGSKGAQRFTEFYRQGTFAKAPDKLEDTKLYRASPEKSSSWSTTAKELLQYLPETTARETGKIATHEIVTDVLPNQTTFRHLLHAIDRELGSGSYQAMMSIPRASIIAMGQAEVEGLLMLTNELTTLSAIAKPRAFHPLLHPYNPPMGNYGGLNRGANFRAELSSYFDLPHTHSAIAAKTLSNPKYTLGAAARFDLAEQYAGKARFFIELRGCKENPDCVEKLASHLTHVFENEVRGFKEFSKLEYLTGGNDSPWRFGMVWKRLETKERQMIDANLRQVFSLHSKAPEMGQHFLYPLKGWDTISLKNDFNSRNLQLAQEAYVEQLKRVSTGETYEEAMKILTPALQNFAHDSGLLEYFSTNWKKITGRTWDVQF